MIFFPYVVKVNGNLKKIDEKKCFERVTYLDQTQTIM